MQERRKTENQQANKVEIWWNVRKKKQEFV